MANDNFADYRAAIEERLRDQTARSRSIDPGVSTQRIKDIQLAQEIERLGKVVTDSDLRAVLVAGVRQLFTKL